MNKNVKIVLLIAAIVILVLIVVFAVNNFLGSFKDPNANAKPTEAVIEAPLPVKPTNYPTPTPYPEPDPTPSGELLVEEDEIEFSDNTITYDYYDPEKNSVVTKEITVEGASTLSSVLDAISQMFFKLPLADGYLNPNSISMIGDSVYIDLKRTIYDAPLGSTSEGSMLSAIYSGYTTSIPDITKVYISVDGSDYSSGATSFPKGKPFIP